jgi:hypothetical protein
VEKEHNTSVRYEVDYTWGSTGSGKPPEGEPSAGDIAEHIAAVYEDAALRGGRVVASHTLVVEGEEHIFFVSEFPDN